MRLLSVYLATVSSVLFAQPVLGFGSSGTSTAASSSSSGSTSSSSSGTNDEVAFLQTLQAAQVSSMSCLITLVNMTVNPIGSCLGLTTLSELVVHPSDNSSFSDQLAGYLKTACGGGQCTDAQIGEAKAQIAQTCQSSKDTQLVQVISAILDNYTNSYRTLACSVYFNGTADSCLSATLNQTKEANNKDFFNNLVTGNNLAQYQDTVFHNAECTGCMYELYKSAIYMIPSIRGNSATSSFGGHLQYDCGNADGVDWSNVQDQQIPDALQVQQSTGKPTGDGTRRYVIGDGGLLGLGTGMIMGALGVAVMLRRLL